MSDHAYMSPSSSSSPPPVYEYKSTSCVPYESMSHVSSCFSWWMKSIEEEWRKREDEYCITIDGNIRMHIYIYIHTHVILLIPQTCLCPLIQNYLHALPSSLYHEWTIHSHKNTVEFILSWFQYRIDWSHRYIYILKHKENTREKKRNNRTATGNAS